MYSRNKELEVAGGESFDPFINKCTDLGCLLSQTLKGVEYNKLDRWGQTA
ncbi:hypothetical protein HanIR_Chr09g0405251 [Helianthus annuus]|nr:hypothetical protein HanIR_Chr09g0405251 [Helianthus annuus]